ncbi:MAG: ATP-binding protein, partial [Smithella sp.]|nr:ATP-binding protein [Smithella sp.]
NKRLMDIVLRGKDQLEGFVRNFLLLARSVPASRELVDINEIVEQVLEGIKINKEFSNKIAIKKTLSPKAVAFANKEQVRQIIVNIVMNSLQAMEEDGILSIETKQVILDDNKNYAEIKISDTGCGITDEDFHKIFEPFFTKKGKGIGLGLAIVSHILEGYKGRIKMESEPGKGTICRVFLPVGQE